MALAVKANSRSQMSFCKPISPKPSPIFIYNEITPVSGYIASTKAESQFSLCPGLQGMKPHVKLPFSIWTTSNIPIFVCFFPSVMIKGSAKFSHLLYYPLNQPCAAIRCLTQCAMSVPAKYGHCALHWTKYISALWHLIYLHKKIEVTMSVVALRIWKEGIICKGPVISVALVCWYYINRLSWIYIILYIFFLKTLEMLALTSNKCISIL